MLDASAILRANGAIQGFTGEILYLILCVIILKMTHYPLVMHALTYAHVLTFGGAALCSDRDKETNTKH